MLKAQARPIPLRARPFEKTHVTTPVWLKLIIGRELAPSREEYNHVVDALWDGDFAMDRLVEWMFKYGPKQARELFQQALDEGLESVENCPEELSDFFKTLDSPPDWIDQSLIREGAQFIHGTGLTSAYVLRDLALMGGYLLSGFNQSLVMTGALNNGTSRRVAETGKWWMDCTEPTGLSRFGDGFKSTLHVRLIHGLVRRNLTSKTEWDHEKWGLPLSQIDMVATYLGFSVVMLGGLRKLGIPVGSRESKAVMHLWAYACWLMGVEPKWLVQTEREGVVLLQHTFMTQSRPDWTSRELAQALANEPKERSYKHFASVKRWLTYHQHLSISQYFLGTKKLEQLGLPNNITSWYAVISTPPRFVFYASCRLIPGLHKQQQIKGRKQQLATLASMFGEMEQRVIKPDEKHPAHI
ncbi:MAG: oxygenase MpaB family protein [Moraxellaceae bacterium]|nr:oxygenase MpaB family protein [Moraxellaceae bacterium]